MLSTPFTRLVGCVAPVQLAGMGGVTPPRLVAAVADAGGLGMLGAAMTPPEVLGKELDGLRGATAGKVGVNFLMPFLEEACVPVAAEKADVVEFFYDTPRGDLVRAVHEGGALASWQVGSAEEALQAIDAGCDFVVAQGMEAGGHVRGKVSLLVLLDEILSFAMVPVVASGGVGTARGMAAALGAGAAAVRVGSRFVTAEESDAHPDYIAALLAGRGEDTVLTEAFSELWPNAPHRVLRSAVDAAQALPDGPVAEMEFGDGRRPVARFHVAPPDASATGEIGAMALYAGQSISTIVRRQPAAEIVRALVAGATQLLGAAAGCVVEG